MKQHGLKYLIGCLIIIIFGLSGCAQTQQSSVHSSLASHHNFKPTQPQHIKIVQSTQQPYLIVGHVYVKRNHFTQHNQNDPVKKLMKQRAAQLGGDAVINVHKTDDHHVGTIVHYL